MVAAVRVDIMSDFILDENEVDDLRLMVTTQHRLIFKA